MIGRSSSASRPRSSTCSSKPITVNYPDQKVPVFPKYRGKQVLMRDENGLEKCVACGLCAVACPADAIYLEAAENDGTVQAGPRYASVYQIHKTRCIFCGYCEEACPVSAIFMGKDYELAVYSKQGLHLGQDGPARARPADRPRRRRPIVAPCVTIFLDALDRRVLVCDGAMGTMLYAQGHLPQPLLRRAEPHAAGPGRRGAPGLRPRRRRRASRPTRSAPTASSSATFGLADQVHAINVAGRADRAARGARAGVRRRRRSARSASASSRGARPASTRPRRASASRRAALLEGGVDLFILETFRDLNEIGAAIARRPQRLRPADRRADDDRGGRQQLDGTPPEQFAPELERARRRRRSASTAASARRAMLETIERMAATRGRAARRRSPTPASPRDVEGRNIYLCSPEYMASYARRFIAARRAAGRRLLRHDARAHPADQAGGRRGARRRPRARTVRVGGRDGGRARPSPPVPRDEKSRLAHALARGTFVHLVELTPPRGPRFAPTRSRRRGPLKHPRRRRGQHPGRAAGRRAHERAVAGAC